MNKKMPAALILCLLALIAALALAATNAVTSGPIEERAQEAIRAAFDAIIPAQSYEEIEIKDLELVKALYAAKSDDAIIGYAVVAEAGGYAGPVEVAMGMETTGEIKGISVGGASFAETAGLGSKVKDAPFTEQFIGKKANVGLGKGIDSVGSATISSRAVVQAVNAGAAAIGNIAGFEISETPADLPEEEKSENGSASAEGKTGALIGQAKGYESDVVVNVVVGDDGLITSVDVDSSKETEGFGTRLHANQEFAAQFIGKSIPVAIGDGIDALAGATVTSNAVIEAINTASSVSAGATASSPGYQSDVNATVVLDGDVIASVVIDAAGETEGFGTRLIGDLDFANQFVGKSAPFTLGDGIDALAGATVSSEAAVNAVNQAYTNAQSGSDMTLLASDGDVELYQQSSGDLVITSKTGNMAGTYEISVTDGNVSLVAKKAAPVSTATIEGNTATAKAKGYQSDVTAIVTVDDSGVITELKLLTANETEYIGEAVGANNLFISQFVGKTGPFAMGEDGLDIVARATVTSQAAIDAINDGLLGLGYRAEEEVASTSSIPTDVQVDGNTANAKAKGFQSDVTAIVTVDDSGVITELKLLTSGETEYIGEPVGANKDFIDLFIGKTGPFEAGQDGIDVIARATVTSKAAIYAINNAVTALKGTDESADVLSDSDSTAGPERSATAAAMGKVGEVAVTVTLDDEGVVTALVLDTSVETQNIGRPLSENNGFIAQFIGKTGPFKAGEDGIDIIAGATLTSNAVIQALNTAIENLSNPVLLTATAAAMGKVGEVAVTVTLDEAGVITDLVLDTSVETENIGRTLSQNNDFIAQFIGKTGPFKAGEDGIDTIAGATVTSDAVIQALNTALELIVK